PADGGEAGGEFSYAWELVEMVRRHPAGVSVGVAAHPELHPRSPDRESDRRHLARKLEMADFGLTQFFFRAADYVRSVDERAALGCDRPVLPGVMPIMSVNGVVRMAGMNGSVIPGPLMDRLEAVREDPQAVLDVGVDVATRLCRELIEAGAPGIHLY